VRRAAAAVLLLTALAPVQPAGGSGGPRTTSVGVGEREWRIALYRSHVPTGRLRLNVRNFGEDGHDLAIRTRSGRLLAALPELRSGATATLSVRLRRPGRYTVFCSLPKHEAKGMKALLLAE
jgi:hypothetical protein